MRLLEYDFVLEHIPENHNDVADVLSRSVVTVDRSVDNLLFDVFDGDDDNETDSDKKSFVESVLDGATSSELYSGGISILAKIEIRAGQPCDLLASPSIDEF